METDDPNVPKPNATASDDLTGEPLKAGGSSFVITPDPKPEPTLEADSTRQPPRGDAMPPSATSDVREDRSSPPPDDRRDRRGVPPYVWGLLFGCGPWLVLLLLFFGLVAAALMGRGGSTASGPQVGLIHLTGIITASGGGGSPLTGGGGAGAEEMVKRLEQAADDDDIKAIVLRVDSPGGSPVGSDEIYREILRIRREKKKPVIVSMGDVAASGGYYVSASADRIFANPGTMTGSIGVIMEYPIVTDLLKKVGADLAVIKSGKYKDIGNPARPLTPDERALLKNLIMEVYDQFVTAVANGRKMPKEKVLRIADGRVMTGSQAKRYGLVDELGGLHEAVAYAGWRGGIEGEPKVKEIGGGGLLQGLLGSETDAQAARIAQALRITRLLADPQIQEAVRELLSSPQPGLR